MRSRGLVAGLVLAALLAGCGYHLAGRGENIPESARTINIKLFRNRTRERGLDVQLHRAVEEEFRRRGPLTVVRDGPADLVLHGTIRRFAQLPVGFNASDEAVQFQGVMDISLRLTESASGKVLYSTKLLQETLDFGAASGVVVTSSPHFQRGTLDARDLIVLPNVQLVETQRHSALNELIDRLARDIYLQAMEGF